MSVQTGKARKPALAHLFLMLAVQTKAKVLRKYVDKMIALAKDGSLHARRQVRSPFSWLWGIAACRASIRL